MLNRGFSRVKTYPPSGLLLAALRPLALMPPYQRRLRALTGQLTPLSDGDLQQKFDQLTAQVAATHVNQ